MKVKLHWMISILVIATLVFSVTATANEMVEYFIKLSSDQQTLYLQDTYTDPGPDDVNIVLLNTSQLNGHAISKLNDASLLYDEENSIYKMWVLATTGPRGYWSVYYVESDSLLDWEVKNIYECYYGVSDYWDITRQFSISVLKESNSNYKMMWFDMYQAYGWKTQIWHRSSADGITWTAPQLVISAVSLDDWRNPTVLHLTNGNYRLYCDYVYRDVYDFTYLYRADIEPDGTTTSNITQFAKISYGRIVPPSIIGATIIGDQDGDNYHRVWAVSSLFGLLRFDSFDEGYTWTETKIGRIDSTYTITGTFYGPKVIFSGQDVRLIETIPATDVEYLPESASEEPYEIRYEDGKTIIEWRYDSIDVDEVKMITFNSIVHNPVAGEDRMVNESLDLIYINLQGGTTTYSLGPHYVHVYSSQYLIDISTDKKEYSPGQDVPITTSITPHYSTTATCNVQIEDIEGNLVTKVGTIDLSTATPGEVNTYNFTWNTGPTYAGEYLVKAILYENEEKVDEASTGFTILPLPIEQGLSPTLATNKISYSSNEDVEIISKVESLAINYIYESLTVNISIFNPDGQVIFSHGRVITLLPGATNTAKIYWNTGTNPPEEYTVNQKVIYQDQIVRENAATFSIISSIEAKTALIGYIKAEPQSLLMEQTATFSYQVTNIGNVDLTDLTLKVIIVDPKTKEAIEDHTYTEQGLTILKGESHSHQFSATIDLPPEYYLVILQGEIEDTTISIASTYLLVKLPATIIIEPEAFDLNTGTFTAFVSFPEGYNVSTITDAECDGAPAYNLLYDSENDRMILKFRRDKVKVLPIDIHFVVTGHFGDGLIFEGYDDIMKVILK